MAQNKKPEGLCERIHNAISPFRPRTRRTPHQASLVEISSKPVHVRRQHSMSETVPVELGHAAARLSAHSNKNEYSDEREILIVRGQKFVKSDEREKGELNHVHFPKTKDEDLHYHHEGRFSDYISKFKNRMIKTASNAAEAAGGEGSQECPGRRDSFNDKVASYIDRTRVKIRTTTNVGVDDQNPIKKTEK